MAFLLPRMHCSERVICVRLPFPVFVALPASCAHLSQGAGSDARGPGVCFALVLVLSAAPCDKPKQLAVTPFLVFLMWFYIVL